MVMAKKKEIIKELSVDEEIILSCAFRYALGRMTYVVSVVGEELIKKQHLLGENFKYRTVKEIDEADASGSLGMDMDKEVWMKVRNLFDPEKRYLIEANYYNTDKWGEFEAFEMDSKYYSIDDQKEYHTTRNPRKIVK
jgi:DNA-binding GntR family transcriptional regulator